MNILTAKENITSLCKAYGVPVSTLEKEAEVSQGYIRAAKSNLRLSVIDTAAKKFGVTTDDILYGDMVSKAEMKITLDRIEDTKEKIRKLKDELAELEAYRLKLEGGALNG